MDSREHLAHLIAAEHPGPYREDLRTITGTRSDREIAGWVGDLVRRELDQDLTAVLFAGKSVGLVCGLELGSGERVVLKLFHPMHTRSELQAMQRCLEELVACGFPGPAVRSPLFSADQRIVGGFYAHLDGEPADGHQPVIRQELARSLAELARLAERLDVRGLPLSPVRGESLWPASHRSFIDLGPEPATAWIDEVGRRAQAVLRSIPARLQPGHLDWGVKNTRFLQDRVCAVFDWDSLAAASEAEMVGRAAAEFPTQWECAGRLTPTLEETAAFIEEYQQVRGRRFTAEETVAVDAAADYLVAQVARQQQSVGGSSREDGFVNLLRQRLEGGRGKVSP